MKSHFLDINSCVMPLYSKPTCNLNIPLTAITLTEKPGWSAFLLTYSVAVATGSACLGLVLLVLLLAILAKVKERYTE